MEAIAIDARQRGGIERALIDADAGAAAHDAEMHRLVGNAVLVEVKGDQIAAGASVVPLGRDIEIVIVAEGEVAQHAQLVGHHRGVKALRQLDVVGLIGTGRAAQCQEGCGQCDKFFISVAPAGVPNRF